jgi:protein-disulfide isomerase
VPPRRSARQQRLANREANRAIARGEIPARRTTGRSRGSLARYTLAAAVLAALAVAGAWFLTGGGKGPRTNLSTPIAPSILTPAGIPTTGQTLGEANAPHTLDVYEDFQCPNCLAFTHDTEPQIVTDYVADGSLKIVFHDLLVIDSNTGGHESLDAANAARCAADQGLFWPYHDWLFANQYTEGSGAFTLERLKTMGQDADIPNLSTFDACVDAGTHDADIQTDSAASGFTSTPTIIIDNGTALKNYLYATVSGALAAAGISPASSAGASTSPTPSTASGASASSGAGTASGASASSGAGTASGASASSIAPSETVGASSS